MVLFSYSVLPPRFARGTTYVSDKCSATELRQYVGDGNLILSMTVFPRAIPRLLSHHLGSQRWNQTTVHQIQSLSPDISTGCLGSSESRWIRTTNSLLKRQVL